MTIAPSDFATLQRENLLAAYQSLKRVILMNNEFCKAYTKSKQAEIHKFFVLNPRVKKPMKVSPETRFLQSHWN